MAVDSITRAALVDYARLSIKHGSQSFSAAARLFDRETRERAWLLYAWCRRCDDIADNQELGGELGDQSDLDTRLAHIRMLTARALEGKLTSDPAFDCLGVVAAEVGLTPEMAEDVIAGFQLDAEDWRPRTEADMMRYCYHVAGAVGVMMAVVMGVSPQDQETLDRACDLGLAFQLSNIARDVVEDDAAGRCYLPMMWLPFRSRWAVLSAARIYGAIGRKVRKRGAQAWNSRTYVPRWEKALYGMRAFLSAIINREKHPDGPITWGIADFRPQL